MYVLVVKYIGASDVRIIDSLDLMKNGVDGKSLRWDKSNNWQVQLNIKNPEIGSKLEALLRAEGHFAIKTYTDQGRSRIIAPATEYHTSEKEGTRLVDATTGDETIVKPKTRKPRN